jgi:hypothetical protein
MNTLLIILIGALQIGDVITTEYLLNCGGSELNPVMKWLFAHCGMHAVLIVKALLVLTMSILVSKYQPIALLAIAGLYVAVVAWNTYQIWSGK